MTDPEVQAYVDAIDAAHRPLFDRVRRLVLEAFPDARQVISYKIPAFVVGRHRLYVGAWKHGVSVYGWHDGRDGGFAGRHPELVTGRGTIRLRPEDAEDLDDEELRALVVGALGG